MTEEESVWDKLRDRDYDNKVSYTTHKKDPVQHGKWVSEGIALKNEFFEDAARECGVTGHPKEPSLREIAWSLGHSSGFSDVWNYYQQIAELLK